jgi:hypothetical protein
LPPRQDEAALNIVVGVNDHSTIPPGTAADGGILHTNCLAPSSR